MNLNVNAANEQSLLKKSCHVLTILGNTLTLVGGLGVLLGLFGVFDMEIFSLGLSKYELISSKIISFSF